MPGIDNYPELAISAGTIISASPSYPATHDSAGFEAIADFAKIGLLISPGFPKVDRAIEEKDLMSGFKYKFPGLKNMAAVEVSCVYQESDPGQDIVEAASDTTNRLSFMWETPSGLKIGVVGYVTGYSPTTGGPSDTLNANFMIHPVFDVDQIGVVRWTPV